jgi:fumarate reductase subunit D
MNSHINERRSNEPIFWGMFGAGGTFGAVCAPALILSLLLLYPYFGEGEGTSLIYSFFKTGAGRLFLALFISLTAWCGLHRIVHCLHDFKIWTAGRSHLCYGAAALITLLSIAGIFMG